ncbi:MAG TPA: hypothetical protein DDX92_05935 [Flavobacteriales bacterium]|jgi:hypothetical protein|nr:hypothetical protein [Flavobacteriales bacterium]
MARELFGVILLIALLPYFGKAQQDTSLVTTYNPSYSSNYKSPPERVPPTLKFETGILNYVGEIGKGYELNSPFSGNYAFRLSFVQPVVRFLDFNAFVWTGRVSANERGIERNLNFLSNLFAGGFSFTYNFDHFLKEDRIVEPLLDVGFQVIDFNSKTDVIDEFGNTYNYWSDGSIRNVPESSGLPVDETVRLQRDYVYETDLRTSLESELGRYDNNALSIPVTIGAQMNMTTRWKARVSATYHYMFSDYIDGVTPTRSGVNQGDGANDALVYISAGIQYNFTKGDDSRGLDDDGEFYPLDDFEDSDNDGVWDFEDDCMGTPEGVEIDLRGCPLDDDDDNFPNFRDEEINSPFGVPVNTLGVALTEADIDLIYANFYDSAGLYGDDESMYNILYSETVIKTERKAEPIDKVSYQVELARFEESVPSSAVNTILTVPDVKVYDNNGQVIVTAGSYGSIDAAKNRQKELSRKGISATDIVKVTPDGQVSSVTGGTAEFDVNEWKLNESKDIIYRVQVGAFTQEANELVFQYLPNVIKLTSDDGYTRYFTGTFNGYKKAAEAKINILQLGFEGAFVVALQGGKKIPLSSVGTSLLEERRQFLETQESLTENQKNNLGFRVQLGSFKKQPPTEALERFMEIGDIESRKGDDGYVRYFTKFTRSFEEANELKKELLGKGYNGVFVVGEFNGEIIKAKDAIELLNR